MNTNETIKKWLSETKREGVENLIEYMEQNGFFNAPCSTSYHLCEEGGLAIHSLNVMKIALDLAKALNVEVPKESIVIASLLHDIGKAGQFGKPNYVENYVRSRSKNKETGEYDMIRSESKPFTTNSDLIYEEHEIRSAIIASRFIELSEEEQNAILHHNGLWGKLDSSFGSTFDKNQLSMIIHFADLWASRVVEEVEEK